MREHIGKSQKASPVDFFKSSTEYAPKDIQEARFSICAKCPKLIRVTNQCKECGCFMKLKVRLANAECPVGKWGAI